MSATTRLREEMYPGDGCQIRFVETASKNHSDPKIKTPVKDTDPGHELRRRGILMQDKSLHVDKIEAAM